MSRPGMTALLGGGLAGRVWLGIAGEPANIDWLGSACFSRLDADSEVPADAEVDFG
jgi:hypothetical protein